MSGNKNDLTLVARSILLSWQRATERLAGELVCWRHVDGGLEAQISLGDGASSRFLSVKWYLEDGILCQGEREDVQRFHSACAVVGLQFNLDDMALCG